MGLSALLRPSVPSVVEDPLALEQTNIVELGSTFADLGHRTTVLMGDVYLDRRPWEFDNGLRVLPIPTVLHTPFHPGLFPMTPGLTGEPAVREADILQTGEFHQPSTYFASKAAQEAGVPLVLWQETFAPMQAPGSLYQRAFETAAGPRIRRTVQRSIPRTTNAEAYLRRLGVPPQTIGAWIPSGVNADTFAPGESRHTHEDFGWAPDDRVLLL
ncbi:MAG: hypothetical protein ACE5IM_13260, partial [Nitrospinota bacterium]